MALGDEAVVAIVALIVSVIALLGTILQVLQQYFASATGFTNCDPKVIGQWSQGVARKFRYHELRFEVQFDTPVIFVTPASNKTKGPIAGQTNIFITGTPESHKETKTEPLNGGDKDNGQNGKPAANGISILGKGGLRQRATFQTVRATHKERQSQREGIHTADNERATWVTMLSHLQNMESQSAEWQQAQYADNGPPAGAIPTFEDRKLAVALQMKRKSWDTMPDSIKKPYATTTMCHIIEIAAMMGLHWKIFDRIRDIYRAEGNGYMLSGHDVNDLGIMFTFQVCGKSKFHASRIIPADEVKELSFGFVSTLFRKHDDTDNRRLEFEEPRDLGMLQLGSANEIAETLVSFGCNTNSAKYLRDNTKKHGHLFPLAFEMTGMLGRKLHIRNTFFRMLPNPTFYHWDKKFFSLRRLLTAYKTMIDSELIAHSTLHIQQLKSQAGTVVDNIRRARKLKGETGFDLKLFAALDDAIEFCDEFLTSDAAGGKNNLKIVEVVLREHFQLVLHMVNEEEAPETPGMDVRSTATSRHEVPSFEDLNAASPEQKQEKFMDIYFSTVLPMVTKRCTRTLRHAARTFLGPLDGRGTDRRPSMARTPTPTPGLPVVQDENGPVDVDQSSSSASSSAAAAADEDAEMMNNSNIISASEDEITDIWCTLVFRMLCWLLLHDFHKNDVQMGKSEQWGSRLPVYIA